MPISTLLISDNIALTDKLIEPFLFKYTVNLTIYKSILKNTGCSKFCYATCFWIVLANF